MPKVIAIEICHSDQDVQDAKAYWSTLGYTQRVAAIDTSVYERNGDDRKQLASPPSVVVFEK